MSARRRWIICPCCDGDGTRDTLGALTGDDLDAMGEEGRELYFSGGYDEPCETCGGSGKVAAERFAHAPGGEPIVRHDMAGRRVVYADDAEASEHWLRMAESGGGW